MKYSALKSKERNDIERDLRSNYERLHNIINSGNQDETNIEEFNIIKHELEFFERQKARGLMIRSKAQWIEEGEKSTSYFLRLEKHNYCNKLITKLEIDNMIITDAKEILQEEKKYYEKLYSKQLNEDSTEFNEMCDRFTKNINIPRISEDDRNRCDELVTEKELLSSLKLLKNGKSPGTSGLTPEFYKFFWIDIKIPLLESLNYALHTGELSIEQKRGIITLIPKKDKSRLFLKNWRPITLLNTDYKLLAKLLASRIKKVMPYIINEDQTGYISGRFIGCNIRILEDIIIFTDTSNCPGILLMVDFEKAFDSISWKFIEKSLVAYNFGNNFISYVKTLYNDISTTIINNGHTSEWFYPERGVRQGCPISPYLFILSVELLAINIRGNDNIKGITIDNQEIKISQLADDTMCYAQDIESISHILETFNEFATCSGLKVNTEKTKARYLGSLKNEHNEPFNLDWTSEHLNYLGVIITGNEKDHYRLNYKKRIKNMQALLQTWKGRHLSLKGKVTVLNHLALSPLLYLANVITVPRIVIDEVKQIVTDFLWNGKTPKIAYNVIVQNISDGGLKLVDFECKVKSLNVSWVKRLTDNIDARWKAAPSHFYNTNDLTYYFSCNRNSVNQSIPDFYKSIHDNWSEISTIDKLNSILLRNQVIWDNRYITINRQPIFWKKWYEKGIIKLNDILNENGNIMNTDEILSTYGFQSNFLNCLQLRQAIPFEWRRVLAGSKSCDIHNISFFANDERVCPLDLVPTKTIYWRFCHRLRRQPTCINKWQEFYPSLINCDWDIIYTLPFHSTRETKLQSFQYKIINRIIECNKKLHDMKIKPKPTCSYCPEVDTIDHFFLHCPGAKSFWDSFFNWWNGISEVQFASTTEEELLLGFICDGDIFKVLNYCVINAKFYMYKQKLFDNNKLGLYEFLMILKAKLNMEYGICKKNGTPEKFDMFNFIYDIL